MSLPELKGYEQVEDKKFQNRALTLVNESTERREGGPPVRGEAWGSLHWCRVQRMLLESELFGVVQGMGLHRHGRCHSDHLPRGRCG